MQYKLQSTLLLYMQEIITYNINSPSFSKGNPVTWQLQNLFSGNRYPAGTWKEAAWNKGTYVNIPGTRYVVRLYGWSSEI